MLRDTPTGYRHASAGLLVPEDTPRQREVWTRDESKRVDRTIALFKSRSIAFQLRCDDPLCRGEKMTQDVNNAGETVLRCAHKDRVMSRVF